MSTARSIKNNRIDLMTRYDLLHTECNQLRESILKALTFKQYHALNPNFSNYLNVTKSMRIRSMFQNYFAALEQKRHVGKMIDVIVENDSIESVEIESRPQWNETSASRFAASKARFEAAMSECDTRGQLIKIDFVARKRVA